MKEQKRLDSTTTAHNTYHQLTIITESTCVIYHPPPPPPATPKPIPQSPSLGHRHSSPQHPLLVLLGRWTRLGHPNVHRTTHVFEATTWAVTPSPVPWEGLLHVAARVELCAEDDSCGEAGGAARWGGGVDAARGKGGRPRGGGWVRIGVKIDE